MLPGGSRITCMMYDMVPGFHLCCADPAQHLTTTGSDLNDLDRDLSDLLSDV